MSRLQIAINTRHWIPGQMEGIGRYVMNLADRMSKAHPEADFHFIFDRKIKFNHDFAQNVYIHSIFPPARHVLIYPYWYNIRIPLLLKKIHADIFLSLDCQYSLKCPVPGITAIHDINFEHYPQDVPADFTRYLKKNTPKYIRKADKVVTVSEFSKNDIISHYKAAPDTFEVVYNGISSCFFPREEKQKWSVRQKYTGGRPYFLVLGSINPRKNLKRTIEAYTEYRGLSNKDTALLICGTPMWKKNNPSSLVINNPFREDILFTGYLGDDDLGQVVGAAHALLFLSYFEGFGVPVIEAFASGVPVITSNRTSLPEIAGGAAILTDPFNIEEIVEAISKVNNEELRKELIAKGLERAKDFSWDKSADKLWNIIQEVVLKK